MRGDATDEMVGHENYMSRKQIGCAQLAGLYVSLSLYVWLRMSSGGARARWERPA